MKKIALLAIGLTLCGPHMSAHALSDVSPDAVSPEGGNPSTPAVDISIATYGDRTIDLRQGWAGAQACAVQDTGTTCFDSEQEMLEFVDASQAHGWSNGSARLTFCGSSLMLYNGISYGLPVVGLFTRFVTTNLSAVGFDNMTTSYKVGACSSILYGGSGGGGGVYPGPTNAFTQSPNMVGGWNNTISSAYVG